MKPAPDEILTNEDALNMIDMCIKKLHDPKEIMALEVLHDTLKIADGIKQSGLPIDEFITRLKVAIAAACMKIFRKEITQ